MNFRLPVLCGLLIILQACATIQREPIPEGLTEQPPADWVEREQSLISLNEWRLAGKLAVRQPSDSGSALINSWQQSGPRYQISLSSSFLGLGRTEIDGLPGFVRLTLPDGESYQSSDPEALVAAATGWELPLESLTWWIKGLPDPGADYRLLFDESTLSIVRQYGWEIHYDRWNRFMTQYPELPARITAFKGDKRVRLVVTEWQESSPQ